MSSFKDKIWASDFDKIKYLIISRPNGHIKILDVDEMIEWQSA